MVGKQYKNGVILGRFQPIHNGHVHMIEEALSLCEHVLLFIGSSQEARTKNNPFSYEERKALIQKVFGDKIVIAPLPDLGLGNVHAWGEHIIEEATNVLGGVDCFVLGSETKNVLWLSEERRKEIALYEVSRLNIPISGTKIRELLINGNKEEWLRFSPKEIAEDYEFLAKIVRGCNQ